MVFNTLLILATESAAIANRLPMETRRSEGGMMSTLARAAVSYTLIREKKTWKDAKESCKKRGMALASICSTEEQYLASEAAKGTRAWIGLNDIDDWTDGYFSWAGNQQCLYRNWREGEPNDSYWWGFMYWSEDCVELYHGEWNDRNCDDTWYFLCESRQAGSEFGVKHPVAKHDDRLPHCATAWQDCYSKTKGFNALPSVRLWAKEHGWDTPHGRVYVVCIDGNRRSVLQVVEDGQIYVLTSDAIGPNCEMKLPEKIKELNTSEAKWMREMSAKEARDATNFQGA